MDKIEMRYPEITLHVHADIYTGEVEICGIVDEIGNVSIGAGEVTAYRCRTCKKELDDTMWESLQTYNKTPRERAWGTKK